MNELDRIMNAYYAKWQKYIEDNNIDEDDERYCCWGWQFEERDFISSPEMLLACYIYAYDKDATGYLHEHFIEYPDCYYTEMAKKAIEIYNTAKEA